MFKNSSNCFSRIVSASMFIRVKSGCAHQARPRLGARMASAIGHPLATLGRRLDGSIPIRLTTSLRASVE